MFFPNHSAKTCGSPKTLIRIKKFKKCGVKSSSLSLQMDFQDGCIVKVHLKRTTIAKIENSKTDIRPTTNNGSAGKG